MSNIYIQEPPTNGKVLLKTTIGDIDIELWSREAPKACRNFVQLCMEGYYNGTIFHRIVKDFIVQGGDPTGTGMGGESIYDEPFRDEFHSRLRFVRRGLVAMANSGPNDNGSQFFFTLGPTQELQNKHTVFGKVTGATLYNMIKLGDSIVDQNERPLYPHKIISIEILSNPFNDIVPRLKSKEGDEQTTGKTKEKGVKSFSLLSFGDEAEEEEEEINEAVKQFKNKGKSSHDLLKDDPKLSSIPAVDESELNQSRDNDDVDKEEDDKKSKRRKDKLERIKNKLQKKTETKDEKDAKKDEEEEILDEREAKFKEEQKNISKVRDEFNQLKKQMLLELRKKDVKQVEKKVHNNPAVEEFFQETKKYKEASSKLVKKGVSREEQCLALLAKFKTRLLSTREKVCSQEQGQEQDNESETSKPAGDKEEFWLAHELRCQKEEEGRTVLAKDANMRNEEDWYDIYDPRNPINKRRREAGLITTGNDNKKKKAN